MGPTMTYQYGREAAADRRYSGLGDVNASLAPSFFAEWQPLGNALDIYARGGKSIDGSRGWNYLLEMTAGFPLASSLDGFVDVLGMGGDTKFTQAFYGVSAPQSVRSGYSMYTPGAGLFDITTTLGVECKYWVITTSAGILRYTRTAAESPLLERSVYTTGNLFITYRFQ